MEMIELRLAASAPRRRCEDGKGVMDYLTPPAVDVNIKCLASRLVQTTMRAVVLALLAIGATSTPSRADTGLVSALVTKGGFIVGVGGGHGTLLFHGHSYPLVISGMSFGATIGLSTARLRGHAYHMRTPLDIAGTYSAVGAGAAVAAGAGGVRLRNAKGVVLELSGARVGIDLSVAMSGVTIRLR
jgi:hypothetical protein